MSKRYALIALTALAALVLAACETNPAKTSAPEPPKPEISFVDLQDFDKDLHGSLAVPLPSVNVVFLDPVSPNAMPPRLQTWLAAVESGGGKVKVTPPKSDIVAKDPFLVIGLVNALWHASNFAKDAAVKSEHDAAKKFDAEIVLKQGSGDNSVVDRVIFTRHE